MKKSGQPAAPVKQAAQKSLLQILRENLLLLLLTFVTLVIAVVTGWAVYDRFQSHNLTVATANTRDESCMLMQAFKTVLERHHPDIKLYIRQTYGTAENLDLLEKGAVQLAAASSNVPAGTAARSVVRLFEDTFQLPVHKGSGIASFPDLKGKRVALPQGGAQQQSFLLMAGYYGLKENEFAFVGGDNGRAYEAYFRGDEEARFAVRPTTSSALVRLLPNSTLLSLEPALRVMNPAYDTAVIPKGAYSGDPLVPTADVSTIAAQRVLLARSDLDSSVVRAITEVLLDRRNEIAAAIAPANASVRTLTRQFALPSPTDGAIAPIHIGATSYSDPHPPSFVSAHSDIIALAIAALALVGCWIAELRRRTARLTKERVDHYNRKILLLTQEANDASDEGALAAIDSELMAMMVNAIDDKEAGRLSEYSFSSIGRARNMATDFVKDRRTSPVPSEPLAAATAAGASAMQKLFGAPAASRWNMSRYLQAKSN